MRPAIAPQRRARLTRLFLSVIASAMSALAPGLRPLRRGFLAALCLLLLSLAGPGPTPLAPEPARAEVPSEGADQVDFAAWEKTAAAAEKVIADPGTEDRALDALRGELAEWRSRFQGAQTANDARIATVREQLSALGPAPTEGESDPPEIAARRKELNEALNKLQAPGIAAEEAYRHADGLIKEIDRKLRSRQTDALLTLKPSPLNPANWGDALAALRDSGLRLYGEAREGFASETIRSTFVGNLPLILGLLLIAGSTTIYGSRWIQRFADRFVARGSQARERIFAFVTSIGQVLVPTVGMFALSRALKMSGFFGELTSRIVEAMPIFGLTFFLPIWLGSRLMPRSEAPHPRLRLDAHDRARGRFLSAMAGLVLVAELLRTFLIEIPGGTDAASSVTSFPILVAGGIVLWEIGTLLRKIRPTEGSAPGFGHNIIALIGLLCRVIGLLGPVLAAFGYVVASDEMVTSALLSLFLLTFLVLLQGLLSDIWLVLTRSSGEAENEGLVPVLLGFALVLLAIPVFALIWGARLSDLTELWTRFREGFRLGDSRISPTDFLIFVLIFMVGYLATRLFQSALRSTILPRTRIERGGQNALVSGAGYIGIFLSALLAINATGIDLSGLAIVASALSVGIGFGLQNIVQNFVSGIILMIERPISEGDWISVGTTEGVVQAISVRSTRIQAFDRSVVVVPNADLVSQRVTNFTRFNLAGRLIVPISVSAAADSRKVEAILREIAEAQPMVILNPPPSILLQSFGNEMLNFEIRVILRDVNAASAVRNEINHEIVRRFREEGISTEGVPTSRIVLEGGAPDQAPRPSPASPFREEAP